MAGLADERSLKVVMSAFGHPSIHEFNILLPYEIFGAQKGE